MKIQGRYDLILTFSFFKCKNLEAWLSEYSEISLILDVFTDWPKSQKNIRNLLKHMQSKLIGMHVVMIYLFAFILEKNTKSYFCIHFAFKIFQQLMEKYAIFLFHFCATLKCHC